MNASRRQFIGHVGTGLAAYALGGLAPRLFAGPGSSGPRAFILIQLEGGHDGLGTFVPWHDDRYHQLRPTLAAARSDLISLGENASLHRAGRGLEPLFKDGRLAVVQNVGCVNPSPSHYRSTEIWHTAAEADEVPGSGWLGRCMAQMQTESRAVAAFHGGGFPRVFSRHVAGAQSCCAQGHSPPKGRSKTVPLQEKAGACLASADALAQLAEIAECAAASGATEIYFVSVPGFDTHFDQAQRHAARLQAVADALLALQRRLVRRGVADRVLTMAFSEFGRSAAENAQGGTDHGNGGPVLLLGASVRGGFHKEEGAAPMDFRRVLSTVADRWLTVSSPAVLGRRFEPLGILT